MGSRINLFVVVKKEISARIGNQTPAIQTAPTHLVTQLPSTFHKRETFIEEDDNQPKSVLRSVLKFHTENGHIITAKNIMKHFIALNIIKLCQNFVSCLTNFRFLKVASEGILDKGIITHTCMASNFLIQLASL